MSRSGFRRSASAVSGLARALFATLALTLGGVGALQGQSGVGQVSLAIGTPGPNAALQDLQENDVELLDFVGDKPTLIEFWASWCEQCEALQPQIDQVVDTYGDQVNVVAVAVAVAQSLRRVRRHVEDEGHAYPFLWDVSGAAVRAYESTTTSIVVILDGEGNVAYTGVGPDQDLIGAVETILSND